MLGDGQTYGSAFDLVSRQRPLDQEGLPPDYRRCGILALSGNLSQGLEAGEHPHITRGRAGVSCGFWIGYHRENFL
jgi:hypothetical protein